MIRRTTIALATASLFLGACATKLPKADLSAFEAAKPHSILIVPAVNQSLFVEAPNYVLSSLTVPLANKGYYVFPVNTVKTVLEQEGLYEPERVQQLAPEKLAAMFGADSVLYVKINRWDTTYAVISSSTTVDMEYRIVDKSGQELWKARKQLVYTPQQTNTGSLLGDLVAAAVVAAIQRAAPDYMPLVNQANAQVFLTGPTALPPGPYARQKGQSQAQESVN